MSERRGNKRQASPEEFTPRSRSRNSSPAPDGRNESGNDSALQKTSFLAVEGQPSNVRHHHSVPGPSSAHSEMLRPPSTGRFPFNMPFLGRQRGRKQTEHEESQQGEGNLGATETPESYGLFVFGDSRPSADCNIDIVAVHGLGGHWEETWTHENGKLWLRDFLPSQLPKARIMSYGYNSKIVFTQAVTDINDEAAMLLFRLQGERDEKARPIIFICHSLGGIVVKKALILAHERSNTYGDLLDSVRGSMFFGVPHRGADIAYWANFATNIMKITPLGFCTNTKFVAALQKNSSTFADISQQFIERAVPLKIRTFYEAETLHNLLVVDRDSACLGLANEIAVAMAGANHKTICKFHDDHSQKYKLVKHAIKELSNHALPRPVPSTAPPPKEQIECLQSLCTSDYNSHYERVPPPVQGTCIWFLQHQQYITWREEQNSSLLWVSADPGCGKSVLSSFLVNKLRDTDSQALLPGTVCFFFFKDDNDEQKNATFALCALLHQIFTAKNSLIRYAMTEFNNKGQRFTGEFHTLWKIFTAAAADPDSCGVTCVIDGLDECEEQTRKSLISSLAKLYLDRGNPGGGGNHLKIIITSRPYKSIIDGFYQCPRIRLKGENETDAISADIKLVIDARVKEVGRKQYLSDDVRTKLRRSLTENADRTFLWVSLILEILENTPEASENELNKIINSASSNLDAIYEKILASCKRPQKAKKILHIVAAAVRPLTLQEMNIALAIEPDHKSVKDLQSNLLPSVEIAVKELCGLFVRVIDSKIYFVHQTAREFLINDSGIDGPIPTTVMWKHGLHPVESNTIIANICLRYLLIIGVEAHSYTIRSKFLDYSAKHWAAHLQNSQTQELELLDSALEVCNTGSKRFLTWFQVYWATGSHSECPRGFTDLMVASRLGIEALVRLMLIRGDDVNAHDQIYGGALNQAARGMHRGTSQVLLENKAGFYLYGKKYSNLSQVREPPNTT